MESLSFYDVENLVATTALDIGTVAPRSSDDSMLRVLNTSSLYQAQDVTVTLSGDDASQLWLSTDGDTFTASINLGDIAPGASSQTFWLRRVTPAGVSGGCDAVLAATPALWSHPIDTSTSANTPLETGD